MKINKIELILPNYIKFITKIMVNQFIFPIKDINNLILLKYTKVSDLFSLISVNKYYYNYLSNLPLIKEITKFNKKKLI